MCVHARPLLVSPVHATKLFTVPLLHLSKPSQSNSLGLAKLNEPSFRSLGCSDPHHAHHSLLNTFRSPISHGFPQQQCSFMNAWTQAGRFFAPSPLPFTGNPQALSKTTKLSTALIHKESHIAPRQKPSNAARSSGYQSSGFASSQKACLFSAVVSIGTSSSSSESPISMSCSFTDSLALPCASPLDGISAAEVPSGDT